MADIDRDTDELVRRRSASLLGANIAPQLTGRVADPLPTTGAWGPVDPALAPALRGAPDTTDPAAADLRLTPADPARDLSAALASYDQPDPGAPAPIQLNLAGVLAQAQRTGREFLSAEEDYTLAAIDLLLQRHLWGPRFFATTSAGVTATGTQGDFAVPLNVINQLRATQRLPSGGELEASFLWNATEQLRAASTGRYTQSSELVLSARVPLLAGAGQVAREDLLQAERDLVYAARAFEQRRRDLLVSLAGDYFELQQQVRQIANQQRALELLRRLERRTGALVEAGRLAEFQRNIAASDVLRAEARLANQRESYLLAVDRFKIRLGLPIAQPVQIDADLPALPEPASTPALAGALALQYRLDLQTQQDQLQDAKRRVANADNELLPQADLTGSARLRTRPGVGEGGLTYDAGDGVYSGGVRVDWPLDRRQQQLALRAAQIDAQRAQRDAQELADRVVLTARASVREIDRARFNLDLQERAVQINLRRAKEQEIKADEVTAQQIVDTANALRDAENARDQARTDLANAVLNHLSATGQLRLTREGQLELPATDLPAPAEPAP